MTTRAEGARVAAGGDDADGADEEDRTLDELERGEVDPRLLRPDPGESREAFERRLLAAVLGLEAGAPPGADGDREDGDAEGGDAAGADG